MPKESIYIIHSGKAAYPEIPAYKKFFEEDYLVTDGPLSSYLKLQDKNNQIAWCIMGFYPKSLPAKIIIHDYRSLSVGGLPKIKDLIKRNLSHRPHIRIFQNPYVQEAMGFQDNTPNIIIPMGIPEWIKEIKETKPTDRFCYTGAISKERNFEKIIKAYLENDFPEELMLVGPYDEKIYKSFKSYSKIIFTGMLQQQEALQLACNSKFCMSTVPNGYPYDYQAPTKLLEYLSMGKTVICNESKSHINFSKGMEKSIIWASDEIFDSDLKLKLSRVPLHHAEKPPLPLFWNNAIKESGISDAIKKAMRN